MKSSVLVGILVLGLLAMTVAYPSGDSEYNINSRDAPQAPLRKKRNHVDIRKRLQALAVLKVSEEESLVPLIEYTDGSGVANQYIARLLPGADYGQITRIIKGAENSQEVKFSKDKDFVILRNISASDLLKLRRLTNVIEEIEQDVKAKLNTEYCSEEYTVSSRSGLWGLDTLDGVPGDSKFRSWGDGAGIDVYVGDTGVNPDHRDFTGRVTIGWPTSTSVDSNGHGTHVASIIGGEKYGVAKQANIISLKICDYSCPTSGILQSLLWIEQRVKKSGRLSVVNLSIGGPYNRVLNDAVDDVIEAGIPVVVAAGNDYASDACDFSPASSAASLTVGAFNANYERAGFSNLGPCVDLYAPGESITAASHWNKYGSTTMSGTSMAAPFVTGAVAALLQVLRDNGKISTPSAEVINYAEIYIKEQAKCGKLSNVKDDHLVLYTPCLEVFS